METNHTFFNHNQTQEQISICISDVSLYADCSHGVREPLNTDVVSNSFSEKNITSVFAQYFFPCQTIATERSGFDEVKSSVLGEDIPARLVEGQEWSHVAHGNCVSGAHWAPSNAYKRSGYIVTPLERCRLQHDTYDRHN